MISFYPVRWYQEIDIYAVSLFYNGTTISNSCKFQFLSDLDPVLPYLNMTGEDDEKDASDDYTDLDIPKTFPSESSSNSTGNQNTSGEVPHNSLAQLCDNDVITSSFFAIPQVYNNLTFVYMARMMLLLLQPQ